MPLSEHEQRLLEEMEQALSVEDPKFASQMRGSGGLHRIGKRAVLGGLGFVAGLALIVVGIMSFWVIGVVGFVLMVAAGAYALTPESTARKLGVVGEDGHIRRGMPHSSHGGSSRSRAPRSRHSGTFMDRLEERWERRRGQGY